MSYSETIDNINTRIENIISNRLPQTYQHITIEPSKYNPTIDENITVTITVKDQSDNPISGFTVPLKINGESITGLSTNNNGQVIYNYTCDEWGITKFDVNSYTAFIQVTGWKLQQTLSNQRVHVYQQGKQIKIDVNGTFTPSANTLAKITDINSAYAPPHNIVAPGHHYNNTPIVVTPSAVYVQNNTTGTSIGINAIIYYDI